MKNKCLVRINILVLGAACSLYVQAGEPYSPIFQGLLSDEAPLYEKKIVPINNKSRSPQPSTREEMRARASRVEDNDSVYQQKIKPVEDMIRSLTASTVKEIEAKAAEERRAVIQDEYYKNLDPNKVNMKNVPATSLEEIKAKAAADREKAIQDEYDKNLDLDNLGMKNVPAPSLNFYTNQPVNKPNDQDSTMSFFDSDKKRNLPSTTQENNFLYSSLISLIGFFNGLRGNDFVEYGNTVKK